MTKVENEEETETNNNVDVELHSLQDSWTYYIYVFKESMLWEDCTEKVATFSTIEHYWSVRCNTVRPSDMVNGNDLYMFKSDIKPEWEDPKNESGGRWLIFVGNHMNSDKLWDELLMLLIGSDWDTDEEADQICGAVFQPRTRGKKIAVWLTNADDEEIILKVGKRVKERLSLGDTIYFQPVTDQKKHPRGKDMVCGKYSI